MHSPWVGIVVVPLTVFLGYALGTIRIHNEISYGIFLNHMVVVGVLRIIGIRGVIGILLVACITPGIAWLSRTVAEAPCLKWKL